MARGASALRTSSGRGPTRSQAWASFRQASPSESADHLRTGPRSGSEHHRHSRRFEQEARLAGGEAAISPDIDNPHLVQSAIGRTVVSHSVPRAVLDLLPGRSATCLPVRGKAEHKPPHVLTHQTHRPSSARRAKTPGSHSVARELRKGVTRRLRKSSRSMSRWCLGAFPQRREWFRQETMILGMQ